ncbi:hypothetical protein HDU93_009383, partial [Gonapodya sp. JEL0774]
MGSMDTATRDSLRASILNSHNRAAEWLAYVRFERAVSGSSPQGLARVRAIYKNALEHTDFGKKDSQSQGVELWLEYAQVCATCLASPDQIRSIYSQCARTFASLRGADAKKIYTTWAAFERTQGDTQRALELEAKGVVFGGAAARGVAG